MESADFYGELFSALDKLAAAKNLHRRAPDCLRPNRRDLVLRDPEVHPCRLSTDPAGAVSARCSRNTARNGLPLLPQFCRCRGAFESAEHTNLHGLSSAGAGTKSKAGAGALELENRSPGHVGANSSH